MEQTEVIRTTELDAPIGDVWRALTDSDELSNWLADDVELDVRPGGVGRMRFPDGEKSVLVTEVEPERRLSLLWWGDDGETSSVELVVIPREQQTTLRVIERTTTPTATCMAWGRVLGRFPTLQFA
jgi:uncharacterized protein YndB with AHSA1/START domain